jgi:hypothetical protein
VGVHHWIERPGTKDERMCRKIRHREAVYVSIGLLGHFYEARIETALNQSGQAVAECER